ncbi:RNA polymerase subunit sigma-24 [Alkalihalophilus pseudofirmus]|uniref:RNA polymerase sigma factor n=1 Tax=Alkalihalophilus pseudofirmus TaxID=79885 RepID=A0AAJ2KVA6_ALKPS|nr:RNA polymerase sigma factor [Alkalihalophilus pseudofirmus]MDV2884513.1 RNA polymerase sigma factor [Alkalihalophilus pseudofirmus]OLS38115.1 RNA polymerase subunit sigma-24 [Alkalihalophilus pseudofirmus]
MNVKKLVAKAKKGNKEALVQLIMARKDDFYRLAYSYMGNEHDAMDAMEEMIVILYEKIEQLQKNETFYSWSKTILVNHCKTSLTKRKKMVLIDDWQEAEDQAAEIQHSYFQIEQQLDIQELLSHINEHQREAIELKYFHDLDYQTIAKITNAPVGTVKSRVAEGLKKLRRQAGGAVNE